MVPLTNFLTNFFVEMFWRIFYEFFWPIFWRNFLTNLLTNYFDEIFWQFFLTNFLLNFDFFWWFFWPLIFQPIRALGSEYLRSCFCLFLRLISERLYECMLVLHSLNIWILHLHTLYSQIDVYFRPSLSRLFGSIEYLAITFWGIWILFRYI